MRAGVEEFLGDDDGCGAAVGGWAALELCEGFVDHGGFEDLLQGVFLLELGVGVALGVFVVDSGDFREVFVCCAVPVGS